MGTTETWGTLAVKMLGRACRVSPHRLALPCTRSFVSKPTTDLSNCTITWDDYTSRLRLRRRGTLQWHREPKTVLLIKKWKDERVTKKAREIAQFLTNQGLTVLVEPSALDGFEEDQVETISSRRKPSPVDFCVTLGGDGTLLHLSRLLDTHGLSPGNANGDSIPALPPTISFGMGTLGFLTCHDVSDYETALAALLSPAATPLHMTLRTRLMCEHESRTRGAVHVLNECVLASSSSTMAKLSCFIDGRFVTEIAADGLIISTPSGSTAYNMSAGGCLVAPSVPCILLTPIAAHALSMRPIAVHEASQIEIRVNEDSRAAVTASFDGVTHRSVMLEPGTSMNFRTSPSPIPLINVQGYDHDWFDGLKDKFHWSKQSAWREN